MLWAVEALGPAIVNRLSQWDRGLWTRQQALDGLLADLAFTLSEHPDSRAAVAVVIEALRPSVTAELAGWLAERRSPDGWVWPPIGAVGSPSGRTVFGPAGPAEVAVYETLDRWFRGRATYGFLPNTEPGAAPDTTM